MNGPTLQFSLKNESAKPLVVYVEMTPERYLLKTGETLEIFGQPSAHRLSFVWHDEGLTIFPEINNGEEHRIDGADPTLRSWSD
jgi:hypothetical protein